MTPGFIGTGAITTALVTGLCTSEHPPEVLWVSPRNPEKAAHLASAFDEVRVASDNQEVVDRSNVLVLAVIPSAAPQILEPLRFRKEHVVLTLLAGTPLSQVQPLAAPAERIIRAVPLPSAARHLGPVAVHPADDTAEALFRDLGTVIVTEAESALDKLLIITSLMAPYYALLKEIVSWAEDAGVDRKNAAGYTASMFQALSHLVQVRGDGDLAAMARECMTPGGLNELALETMEALEGFKAVRPALEAVEQRVSGRS